MSPDDDPAAKPTLTPTGRLGLRGRHATPEERARMFDAFFFEGDRRRPYMEQFLVLMLLSAAIAGFGLTNDSAAVVIGAMLVAPLMTPILGTAAAIVQGWGRRAAESLGIILAGAAVAIIVGVIIAIIEPRLTSGAALPGELLARTKPNMTDLAIAIAAGAAGAFVTVRSEASGALPGVGIAVALVPPLATVGMCLGLGETQLAAGALLLFGTNLVAIILAAGVIFTLSGFAAYRAQEDERRARIAALILLGVVILFALPLGSHGFQQYQDGRTHADVREAVQVWAPDLEIESIELESDGGRLGVEVMVTGTYAPPPASSLASTLAEMLERPVGAEVVFVPVDVADSDVE